MNTDELQPTVPAAFLYTLEYGNTVVDQKVSVYQLNYPFGVCGADYLAKNEDGVSYVRQTPLYTTPPAAPVQNECVVCGDKVRVIPRQWVGLTKEERDNFVMDCGSYQTVADIEAKLREKNGGQA